MPGADDVEDGVKLAAFVEGPADAQRRLGVGTTEHRAPVTVAERELEPGAPPDVGRPAIVRPRDQRSNSSSR